jgi:sensor domain CHASE-containing protein
MVLVTVLGGGLLLLLVAALGWFAMEQDLGAARHSQRLAEGAIKARIVFTNRSLTQYAVWDDPIDRVVQHLDHKWADETIGPYVYDELHIEQSYVVLADGTLRYAMRGRLSGPAQQHIDPGLARLGIEVAQGLQSQPLGRLMEVDGQVAIVAIQKIVPSTNRYPPGFDSRAALIFVDLIDSRSLAEIAQVYALNGLRLINGPGEDADPALELRSAEGARIGWLTWDAVRPGTAKLKELIPVVVLIAVAVAAAAALILRGMSDLASQMFLARRTAEDALVRARVARQAAEAARGHADRLQREMTERAEVEKTFAELRDGAIEIWADPPLRSA